MLLQKKKNIHDVCGYISKRRKSKCFNKYVNIEEPKTRFKIIYVELSTIALSPSSYSTKHFLVNVDCK